MFGVEELRRSAPRDAKFILGPSAWESLNKHLTARLVFALAPTLRLERNATKAVARSFGKRNNDITLSETIKEFPGALETAALLIANWIDAQHELLNRLVRDRRVLRSVFLQDRQSFRIMAIRPGLSDPHNGGRTVTLVEFAGKRRVIYKPRSLEGEELWFAALRWLNRNGLNACSRTPTFVSQQNYSWMEYLKPRRCRSAGEVRRFYFRWGAQTALAQILRASDLHWENWLAVGPQPILVDAEMVGSGHKNRQSLPALLETGLLRLTVRDRAGSYNGIAPLDAMLSGTAAVRCWARYKGVPRAPRKYVNDLVRGFEAVAKIFSNSEVAKAFFAEIILPMTRKANVRMLFRASEQYARLLRESLEPVNMFSRKARRGWLARECCASVPNRRIGLAEARALLRCDIPKFVARQKICPPPWKAFSTEVAALKDGARVLRNRVLLRSSRPPAKAYKRNLMPRG